MMNKMKVNEERSTSSDAETGRSIRVKETLYLELDSSTFEGTPKASPPALVKVDKIIQVIPAGNRRHHTPPLQEDQED
jgi:hypothetical protein